MSKNDKYLPCVKVILEKCCGDNEERIEQLARHFFEKESINKTQTKKITEEVGHGCFGKAIRRLVSAVSWKHEKMWKVQFLLTVGADDFPGDKLLAQVIRSLLSSDDMDDDIDFLIKCWSDLLILKDDISRIIELTWPEQFSSESFENESSWPLLIINHCMSTYDDEGKVRTFVADIKRIVKEKKEAEKKKNWELKQAQIKEQQDSQKERDKDTEHSTHNTPTKSSPQNTSGKKGRKKKKKRNKSTSKSEQDGEQSDVKGSGDTSDQKKSTGSAGKPHSIQRHAGQQYGPLRTSPDTNTRTTQDGGDDQNNNTSNLNGMHHTEKLPEGEDFIFKSAEELRNLEQSKGSTADIEFRVIVPPNDVFPPRCSLFLFTHPSSLIMDDCSEYWIPIKMEFHKIRQYYYVKIPVLKKTSWMEYKYFLLTNSETLRMWEKFYDSASPYANRKIFLKEDRPSVYIVHDVLTFKSDKSWNQRNQEFMFKHLISIKKIVVNCGAADDRKVSYGREISNWLCNVKKGWKITENVESINPPTSEDICNMINEWLKQNLADVEGGGGDARDRIHLITSTLAMVLAMHSEKINVYNSNLLALIFDCLGTHHLSENDYKLLFDEIIAEWGERSIPALLKSIISLFQQITFAPIYEWLLALPLYWLIDNKGEIDKSQKKISGKQFDMLQRISGGLPSDDGMNWITVRGKCCNSRNTQSSLISHSARIHKIYQVHPWIIGSFQYVLTAETLIKLIAEREEYKIGNEFPIDDVLMHLLNEIKQRKLTFNQMRTLDEYFLEILGNQIRDSKAKSTSERDIKTGFELASNILASLVHYIAEDVNKIMTSDENKDENIIWCVNIAIQATEIESNRMEQMQKFPSLEEATKKQRFSYPDKIISLITKRINKSHFRDEDIQFWDTLASLTWSNSEFNDRWHTQLRNEVKIKILNEWPNTEKFLTFYAEKLDNFKLGELVESCFSEHAFNCTEELLAQRSTESKGISGFLRGLLNKFATSHFVVIFDKLFIRELEKPLANQKDMPFDQQTLEFLFAWTFSSQFYRLFGGSDGISKFKKSTRESITKVLISFRESVGLLESGAIKVGQLQLILCNRKKFMEIYKTLIKDGSSTDPGGMGHILDLSDKRLLSFQTGQKYVKGFLSACSNTDNGNEVQIDTTELSAKLQRSITHESLSTIAPRLESRQQSVFFGLNDEVLEEFRIISFIKDSKVFQEMWYQKAIDAKRQDSDALLSHRGLKIFRWRNALYDIWRPMKTELLDLMKQIDDGSLDIYDLNFWFKRLNKNVQGAEKEIRLLYRYYSFVTQKGVEETESESPAAGKTKTSEQERSLSSLSRLGEEHGPALENLELRVRQICSYYMLENAREAIELLLNMKEKFKLTGDFISIEFQKERAESNTNVTIADLADDDELPSVCKIDERTLKTIQLFLSQEELIFWLKEQAKDIGEIKVICEMAMIFAGDTPYYVDRVSCLLSAVMVFNPLLFELDKDSGLKELLEKCKQVWENIRPGEKLREKWEDSGNQLPWFRSIEKLHGSIEKQSLLCTQEINERGIYKIRREKNNEILSVDDAVSLVIPPKTKNQEDKPQKMNLKELQDLQCKLMLIAGDADKGQKDVNMFVDVLTAVEKIAKIFVQLISSGCNLFSEWSVTIRCQDITNSTETNHLLIQIEFTKASNPLRGKGSLTHLRELSTVLSEALRKWDEYIVTQRMEHYYLNEFNIHQISYLCNQLASSGETLPDQVNTLLLNVSNNLDVLVIKECLEEAKTIFDEDEKEDEIIRGQDCNSNMHELKRRAVQELATHVSIDVAKAAVQAVGYEDPDQCLIWSLEHKFDDELIQELAIEFNSEIIDLTQREESSSTPDVIREKQNTVFELMRDAECEENVAKAAVQAGGYGDLTVCQIWIYKHEDNPELIKDLSEKFNQEAAFRHQEREAQVITSVLYDRSRNTLKDVIDRLQVKIQTANSDNLIDSVNTICAGYYDETMVITLQDYLSIDHLGRFLQFLKERSNRAPPVRNLMPPMQTGRPNLIIHVENEILPTVLSLYMNDSDQPLPSTSEVLLCSEQTSADEVERFMRRAMLFHQGGRMLFSLVFADKLSFNISTETERIFNSLSQNKGTNKNYQLVILLSKPQHYLATCFDKYQVDGKWMKSEQEIASYLTKHLKVSDDCISATCVDSERSMVKVVSSSRSGVGKSLHVKRLREVLGQRMRNRRWQSTTIRLLEKSLNLNYVIERLYRASDEDEDVRNEDVMLVHLDLTPAVLSGIETFAFNLFVLGSIQDSRGKIWRRHKQHLYALEMTDFRMRGKSMYSRRHILNLLPCIKCYAPREVLQRTKGFAGCPPGEKWLPMDRTEFLSDVFQRPFQYLNRFHRHEDLDAFTYKGPTGTADECIETLLARCSMDDPSWAQLKHFASFLNYQLQHCENSLYCNTRIIGKVLKGLKAFAVDFMIRMSRDFATPSLDISDESKSDRGDQTSQHPGGLLQLRRKWEESTHPYIFFNEDGVTMTFINVNISDEGHLLDKNGEISEQGIIDKRLVQGLKLQNVSLDLNFDELSREKKLQNLCLVMGIREVFDPDPTYELTTDNVLKILAIYMRFRCQIPVIIMGETGCGKTRMIEFMSRLKAGQVARRGPPEAEVVAVEDGVRNMMTLKIHGGITTSDIHQSVREAQNIAARNWTEHNLSTILFYDEANTTEAIYAIKEVMCDLTINGRSFKESQLQLVAACNPYKKLSEAAIKKLEDSGLGYRIKTSETTHLLGDIPMRTLVYRVVALPPSMQPFVWDFGQLGEKAEQIYIEQMTKKLALKLNLDNDTVKSINKLLSASQSFMRHRRDECRYVSLRDVERCMIIFEWFHKHSDAIYRQIDKEITKRYLGQNRPEINPNQRTLIQTVGVCYHASLDDRVPFRELIGRILGFTEYDVREELSASQAVFLKNMKIDDNIAHNEALQENVFMITVCAETRIPLFLIGKPGSSKSLAKTIVMGNMEGISSSSPLYKTFKRIQIMSYQCSALTDAVGIASVFKLCLHLQAKLDSNTYTAVVVLDEIGLAEDSPNMPLKVLHPLLECGSADSGSLTDVDKSEKVGFVGISNWALDPAKMNRGIFVTRNKPTQADLLETAEGIFRYQKGKINENQTLLEILTSTYLEIYEDQTVEYFGLRDYYSLIKMIHARCIASDDMLTFTVVAYAILRNFSGGRSSHFHRFQMKLSEVFGESVAVPVPIQKIIRDNLEERDSRFLLLLTNQFSVVSLLSVCIDDFQNSVHVVFGSSFPGDHNYTEICRNISKIKVCMETGKTVVLLNMTDIHESLYDVLNQHYVRGGGGRKYVDLGLGGHKVKCRIADGFRLIVVEQKDKVYDEYPIPLINRLEKHHLDSKSLLTKEQETTAASLREWVKRFSKIKQGDFTMKDAFVGAHLDPASSVVLTTEGDVDRCKYFLLQSCAMDGIFRLPESDLGTEIEDMQRIYIEEQVHDSLVLSLKCVIDNSKPGLVILLEITSYSNILSEKDREEVESELDLAKNSVMLLSLEQFQTEQEYSNRLDTFFSYCKKQNIRNAVLLIQCSQAQSHGQLIACAKYCLSNKVCKFKREEREQPGVSNVIVALLLSTERENKIKSEIESLVLQHTKESNIIYVDELRPTNRDIAPATHFYKKSLCEVLEQGKNEVRSEGEHSLVNIKSLLKDCVCEAVAKVKDSFRSNEKRELKRIQSLTKLLSGKDRVSSAFQTIFLDKMIAMYREREEEREGGVLNDWIVQEACNRESLQEGGTFRKTLWLCLKRHVAKMLAYVTSRVDRSNNLDILSCKDNWKIEMWLRSFEVMEMPWSAIKSAKEFTVTNPKHLRSVISCNVPFAFYLHEFFNSQWETLDKQHNMDKENVLHQLFRSSPMHGIIANAFTDSKIILPMMKQYIQDLVKEFYVPGSRKEAKETEYNLVENIIYDLVINKYDVARKEEKFQPGDEFALVFLTFKGTERFLSQLSQIIKACPKILAQSKKWITSQAESEVFCIHILALKDVLDLLKEMADKINVPRDCEEWTRLSALMKPLLHSVLDSLDDAGNQDEKKRILKTWTPLCLLDLLILQLLPSSSQKQIFEKYLAAIAPDMKLFWKGCLRADLRSQLFLKIISNVLRKCYEDVQLKILLSWQHDFTCKYCRQRLKIPVVFPCGHLACSQCAQTLQASSENGAFKCPTCQQTVPKVFDLRPPVPNQAQGEEIAKFQSNCTSFFLEYLLRFCFTGDSNQMENQVDMVLKDIVMQNRELNEIQRAGLDLNINMQSSVLRILLDFNPEFVNERLNEYLEGQAGNLEREHLKDVVLVVLKCYEQNLLLKRMKNEEESESDSIRDRDLALRESWRRILVDGGTMRKIDMLREVAEIRCALREFTACINHSFKEEVDEEGEAYEQREMFNKFALRICVREFTHLLKEFVVKIGCRKYGMEWFEYLAQHDKFVALIPPLVKQAAKDKKTDHWSLLGKSYSETKSSLYKTSADKLTESVTALFQRNPPLHRLAGILAAVTWSQEQDDEEKDFVCEQILKQGQTPFYNYLANVNMALIPALAGVRGVTDQQAHALYQLVTITAATVTAGKYMMEGFAFLASQSRTVAGMYFPAMPEHYYFSTPADYRRTEYNTMYTCPNGHLYSIGECTQPYVQAICPQCGAVIGGQNHRAAQGNKRIVMTEASQAEYLLNKGQNSMADPAERISIQGAAAIQFLLHACMMIGLENDEVTITRMLGHQNKANSQEYLVQQLLKNLKDLSTSLGRNIDHTILIMHKILLRILENEGHGRPRAGDWSSMEKRRNWEVRFREHYLLPIFQNLDAVVIEAESAMNEAENLASGVLYRLVHDLPVRPEPNTTGLKWTDPMLWGVIEHSSSSHLVQTLADSADAQRGEVLQIILTTKNLHLLKNLESVLQLQSALILKYQNNLDLEESEATSFIDFLEDGGHAHKEQIQDYIKTWNQVYPAIQARISSEYFVLMTMNSSISMGLPASRGRGQCAKILAEHLIDIQNDFLTSCKQVLKASDSIREVDVDQLTHSQYVCIDKQKDLLPLIHMHTKYTITTGRNARHHRIIYNIDALEKQAREKFVIYKRLISKNSLQLMRYAQDIGIGSEWGEVLTNTKQQTLPTKLAQDVDRNVSRVPSADVCEGVRTLTHAISFLAKAKEDGKKLLCEFLEIDLLLSASRTSVIPRSAQIENTISLYLRLSWHKSVNFALRGLDPYKDALSNKKQEKITDEIIPCLEEAFQHSDVIKLQQKVNEMLVKIPEYNPEWSLSEIFPDYDFLDDSDDESWFSRIPDDVCFKHISHLFSLAVKFTNKP